MTRLEKGHSPREHLMSEEFSKKVSAVKEAVRRVREGRIERTVLKREGARSYTEAVPRTSMQPDPQKKIA